MQDFIKQSSAHKRRQCCAILDHINVFQSRIIFQRRKNAQKNTGTRSQQILGLLRRGGCRCVVTAQRPRPRGCARRGVGSVLVDMGVHGFVGWDGHRSCGVRLGVLLGCVMCLGAGREASERDASSTWINKYK